MLVMVSGFDGWTGSPRRRIRQRHLILYINDLERTGTYIDRFNSLRQTDSDVQVHSKPIQYSSALYNAHTSICRCSDCVSSGFCVYHGALYNLGT